jgi:dUTP pyrophosphatase
MTTTCNLEDLYLNLEINEESLRDEYFYKSQKAKVSTDSGFDLFIAENMVVPAHSMRMIDLKVRCEPLFKGGYYLYPRSSISKTPLRLANSVGIIDNGYRGTLKCAVDNNSDIDFIVKKGERYFQVCHPSLMPLKINIVESIDMKTERGEGGFGSTGLN